MIRLKDVVGALEMIGDDVSGYASRATGEVRLLTWDERLQAESSGDTSGLQPWEREAIAEAREVLGCADWLPLPTKFEIHEWEIMDDFARSQPDAGHRDELLTAICGSGAFRRFKVAIRALGIERRWFAHRAEAFERLARDWLAHHDLPYG